ncbi:MAG: DUF2141 domain-containing protein [Armatimonas sp.]
MIRPPKPLDLTRACPLVLLDATIPMPAWEQFADKNYLVLASVGNPTRETIQTTLDEACRHLPINGSHMFFVGKKLVPFFLPFLDYVASATEITEPEAAWKELKPSSVTGVAESTLTVTVTGLRNTKGIVAAQLFTDEESYKKKETGFNVVVEITEQKTANLKFPKLKAGTYTLMVLHDENKNGKMDTGLFGIPKEGFAISRDPKVKFGPPRWKDCCFLITNASTEREITVKAQYL